MRQLFTVLLFGWSCLIWSQDDFEIIFQTANEAYSAGDYAEAIAGYESILEDRTHFESEYNLGNAYYKMRDWGSAILHYERAAQLSPSNPDVRTNLILANAQIKDRIESLPSNGILDIWDRIVAPGRFKLWMIIMAFGWILGFGALAWRVWETRLENRRILGTSAAALLSLGLITMLLAWSTSQRIESSKSAIITVSETPIRNEPGTNGMTLFMLHEGTKVTVMERQGEHWEVQLANGNTGWISSSDLTEI